MEEDPDDVPLNEKEDKILEKTSYGPLTIYLQTLSLCCADVHDGARCVFHKAHIKVAIEIKTVKGLQNADRALPAVQLVGLNTGNCEITPVVLLTNLVRKHFVLFLTLGNDPYRNLKYHLNIVQLKSFESALEFALDQSSREAISLNFGRKPTPPASIDEDEVDEDS